MKIINTIINCGMGTSGDWLSVPGISDTHAEALNQIGYTGKLNGVKTSLGEYLESISTEHRNYSITRTGGNSMEFTDRYQVTTVITEASEAPKKSSSVFIGVFVKGSENMFCAMKFLRQEDVKIELIDSLHDQGLEIRAITEEEYLAFDEGDEITPEELKRAWDNKK